MSGNRDAILRKLRAVLAKSEHGSGATDEEARSALAFARRLMRQHSIDEAELAEQSDTEPELIPGRAFAYSLGVRGTDWERRLASAVARMFGGVGVYTSKGVIRRNERGVADPSGRRACGFVFYGVADEAQDAAALHAEWALTIAALARLSYGGCLRGEGRSYAEGFVAGMHAQLSAMEDEERAERDSRALVLATALEKRKRSAALDWLRREHGVHLSPGRRSGGGAHHREAHGAGLRDGRTADLSRSSSRSSARRLS